MIKPLHGTKTEEFEEVLRVNLFSSYYLLSSFARRMKNGSAIFFSSVAGTKGLSNHEAIAAAKAGLEGMARSAAASYAKRQSSSKCYSPWSYGYEYESKTTRNRTG